MLRVTTEGAVGVLTGIPAPGVPGEDGLAERVQLDTPISLAVDDSGNVYIGDWRPRLVRISPQGILTTIAGTVASVIQATADRLPARTLAGRRELRSG